MKNQDLIDFLPQANVSKCLLIQSCGQRVPKTSGRRTSDPAVVAVLVIVDLLYFLYILTISRDGCKLGRFFWRTPLPQSTESCRIIMLFY